MESAFVVFGQGWGGPQARYWIGVDEKIYLSKSFHDSFSFAHPRMIGLRIAKRSHPKLRSTMNDKPVMEARVMNYVPY